MSRILAIDFGTKRIGLAVSDIDRHIASPLSIYTRRDPTQDARYFRELIAEERIGLLLVGLPVHLSGSESEKSRQARQFGAWLVQTTGLPILYWDERFTTADAERYLLDAGLTKKQRTQRLDKVAAQIFLQTYLDAGCPPSATIQPMDNSP